MSVSLFKHDRTTGTSNASIATFVWDGSAGDGLWSTAANWTPGTRAPTSGDTALIASGTDTIDYDVSGGGVSKVHIGGTFAGTFTSSQQLNCSEFHVSFRRNTVSINVKASDVYVYRTSGQADALTINGIVTRLTSIGGNIKIASTATVLTTVRLVQPKGRISRLNIDADASLGTILAHSGSFIDTAAGHSSITIWGRSQCNVTGTKATPTVQIEDESLMDWQSANDVSSSGTMYGGTFRIKGNNTQGIGFDGFKLYGDSVLDLRTGTDGAEEFASPQPIYYGGRLIVDEGRTVAVS